MKKHFYGLFLAILYSTGANGQTTITVVDKENNESIPVFTVYYLDYQYGVVSDTTGKVLVSAEIELPVSIKVQAPGYELFYTSIQEARTYRLALTLKHVEFEEVSVSTHRNVLRTENATHIENRSMEELNEIPSSKIADALTQMPGVYSANTGSGVSKPVIRGFQGMRVMTLLNGVKLENQQWGGDHDLGITDVGVGHVEVIKGPASILYGADALGGVIYFADEDYTQQNQYCIKAGSIFNSNTMGTKNSLSYKFSKKHIRLNIHGNYTNHADYQLPTGGYVENSRYNGYSGKVALGANKGKWATHLRYTMAISNVGIIGEGENADSNLIIKTQPRNTTVPFQYYENHMISWHNKFFKKNSEWYILLAHSFNRLSELEDSKDEASMELDLNNTTYQLRYKYKFKGELELVTGLQGAYQRDINKGAEEQLIPDFAQLDNGLYVFLAKGWENWNLQGGVRYDNRLLKTNIFNDTTGYNGGFGRPNFSLGAVHSSDKNTIKINIASGFRVPHLSELLADGVHHGALRYEIGNASMKSEKMIQLDITEELHNEHFEMVINPFFNYALDYIYLQPMDTIIDGYPAYQYNQLDEAYLYGGDLAIHYHPHFAHWLHWEPSYSIVYAQSKDGSALPFIPQARIINNFKFDFNMKSKFKIKNIVLNHAYYFDQYRVSELETPTKGYTKIDLGLNCGIYTANTPIELSVGVRNMLNANYIDHLSSLKREGVSNPGRNIYVRLMFTLNGKMKT